MNSLESTLFRVAAPGMRATIFELKKFVEEFCKIFALSNKTRSKPIKRQRQIFKPVVAGLKMQDRVDRSLRNFMYCEPRTHKGVLASIAADMFVYLAAVNAYRRHVDPQITYDDFSFHLIVEAFKLEGRFDPIEWFGVLMTMENNARTILENWPVRWLKEETVKKFAQTEPIYEIPFDRYVYPELATILFPSSSKINSVTFVDVTKQNTNPVFLCSINSWTPTLEIGNLKNGKLEFEDLRQDAKELLKNRADPDFLDECLFAVENQHLLALNLLAYLCCTNYQECEHNPVGSQSLGFSVNKKALKSPVFIDSEKKTIGKKRTDAVVTHASPLTHWRSGHFRLQHYGENNSKTKMVWIRPTLVNADGG